MKTKTFDFGRAVILEQIPKDLTVQYFNPTKQFVRNGYYTQTLRCFPAADMVKIVRDSEVWYVKDHPTSRVSPEFCEIAVDIPVISAAYTFGTSEAIDNLPAWIISDRAEFLCSKLESQLWTAIKHPSDKKNEDYVLRIDAFNWEVIPSGPYNYALQLSIINPRLFRCLK